MRKNRRKKKIQWKEHIKHAQKALANVGRELNGEPVKYSNDNNFATKNQISYLISLGVERSCAEIMTKKEASRIITRLKSKRRNKVLAKNVE